MRDDDLAPVIRLPRPRTNVELDNRDAEDRAGIGGITAEQWQPGTCSHRSTTVDGRARTLVCSRCGVPVDPIDALDRIGNQHDFILQNRRTLERDIVRAQETLGGLLREERNAKSRARAARKRALTVDADAIAAAARSAEGLGGYRTWNELNEHQQRVVVERVERIVEAYVGALVDDPDQRGATVLDIGGAA